MKAYPICQRCGLKSDKGRLCTRCLEKISKYLHTEKEKCLCTRCGCCNHYSSSICRACTLQLLRHSMYKCYSCGKSSLRGEGTIVCCDERNDEEGGFCENCNRWFCNKHHLATFDNGEWSDGEHNKITTKFELACCTFVNDENSITCGICRKIDYLAKRVSEKHRVSKEHVLQRMYSGADPNKYTRDQIDKVVIANMETLLK